MTIPASITSIGQFSFAECTSLTNVAIPGSVTSIGDGAFAGCDGLKSIMIPGSVTNMGIDVFQFCTNLGNPVWQPLQTNSLVNGTNYFSDGKWTNFPGRFTACARRNHRRWASLYFSPTSGELARFRVVGEKLRWWRS